MIKKTNTTDFKNISSNIPNVSQFTFFLLIILSILGIGILIHKNIQIQKIEVNETNTLQSTYY